MQRRPLGRRIAAEAVGILDRDAPPLGQRDQRGTRQPPRGHDGRTRRLGPDLHQMRLARPLGPRQHEPPPRPVAPALDRGKGGGVRGRGEEIRPPPRRPMRQIERQLRRHSPTPKLSPGPPVLPR